MCLIYCLIKVSVHPPVLAFLEEGMCLVHVIQCLCCRSKPCSIYKGGVIQCQRVISIDQTVQ